MTRPGDHIRITHLGPHPYALRVGETYMVEAVGLNGGVPFLCLVGQSLSLSERMGDRWEVVPKGTTTRPSLPRPDIAPAVSVPSAPDPAVSSEPPSRSMAVTLRSARIVRAERRATTALIELAKEILQ
jgi:hypothetical protein